MQNSSLMAPKITLDLIDKIPGQLNDRRTMLGELNWIFTAITDTIAWNTLPRGNLFQIISFLFYSPIISGIKKGAKIGATEEY